MMHLCMIKPSLFLMWALDLRCYRKSDPQLSQQTSNSAPFSYSQGRLAAPALWPWHPKMLCPLQLPSQSRLMLTSKELIPLSESHMTSCCWKAPDMGLHAYTYLSIFELQHIWATRYMVLYCTVPSSMWTSLSRPFVHFAECLSLHAWNVLR